MKQIIPGISTFESLRAGRVFLIEGQNGLAIVDSSIGGAYKSIVAELAAIGKSMRDVRFFLVTHAHPDHIGSLANLQADAPDAITITSPLEAAVTRGTSPMEKPNAADLKFPMSLINRLAGTPKLPVARVDREVNDGDTLDDVLPGLSVVGVPGHTRDQIGFWLAGPRLLIGGDAMTTVRMFTGKYKVGRPFPPFTVNMKQAEDTIRKIATMGVDVLCVGHGQPLPGADAWIKEYAATL